MAALLLACSVSAQKTAEREKYDSIAAKYKDQNAVYTSFVQKLEITQNEDDGSLVAKASATMEKLLISDLSATTQNADFLRSYDYSATALIPDKKGGYKRVSNFGTREVGQVTGNFYDDLRQLSVYYTGLTKNSVTITKYNYESENINFLYPFDLKDNLLILNSICEVIVPNFVNIDFVLKNTDGINVKQTKEEKDGKIIYTFTAANVPAFKGYTHVPSSQYYAPHIIPYIKSYRLPGAKKDSVILRDPDALYRYDYSYVKDLNIKLDTALVRIVAEITKNDKTQREKAAHIYNWVQKNIHYIAFEKGLEGLVPRPADTVYKRKYGDCKDMASMCMAMCRQAGIKAYFASIGTNNIPYSIDEIHSQFCFNHEICAINLDGEWVFLDATDNIQPFGENRFDIQGKEALIDIDAKNYKIVKIPEAPTEKNLIIDTTVMHLSNNRVEGSIKQYLTGYAAWDIKRRLEAFKNEDRDKAFRRLLLRGADNYRQLSYVVHSDETGNKDATLSADFKIDDYAHNIGKEYYVNMNLNREFGGERMNDSERRVGYFYPNKEKTRQVVVLEIPEGYKVTHLPESAQGGLDGIWSYKISYKMDKKKITLTKDYELQSLSLSADLFAKNNKVIDGLNHAYKESVVLTANKL